MFFKKDPMRVVEDAMARRSLKSARVSRDVIVAGFATNAGNVLMLVRHEESKQTLLFLSSFVQEPIKAFESLAAGNLPLFRVHTGAGHTPEQVANICEYLLQRNYQMVIGAFERDRADGEIRFRAELPYRDASPTVAQVDWCIDTSAASLLYGVVEIQAQLGQRAAMEI